MPDAVQLGYAASRAGAPARVAHWKKDTADLATPAGWAEKLHTNLTYNYGFYATGSDVYLRLPGNRDPNTLYITAAAPNDVGLVVNGPGVRISGFEIRQFTAGVQLMWDARNAVVDRSLLTGNASGVFIRAQLTGSPQRSMYGGDHTIQENLIQDASLWSADPIAQPDHPVDVRQIEHPERRRLRLLDHPHRRERREHRHQRARRGTWRGGAPQHDRRTVQRRQPRPERRSSIGTPARTWTSTTT